MSGDVPPEPQGLHAGTTLRRGSSEVVKTVYRGHRDPTKPVGEQCTITVDGEPLDCRYDLLSASPAGLGWGYGGSGPAQLSIAILAHAFDDEFACEYYQRFKREVIAQLPERGWTLTATDIEAWREVSVDE
jgi:hypothetical protein